MASSRNVGTKQTTPSVLSNSLIRKIAASKKSGVLNLRGEELTSIPHEAYHREDLLSQDSWFDVVDLVQMVVSHNELETLPDDWEAIPELKLLDASHNKLKDLPKTLFDLKELKSLDISYNQFSVLPEEVGNTPSLVTLLAAGNQLTSLSSNFGSQCHALTKLDLSNNTLSTLPDSLRLAEALVVLNLEKNALREFPGGVLAGLTSLEELNLSHNQLTKLPVEIQHLKSLKVLIARNNQLSEIPAEISGCVQLLEMHLGYNRLNTIPESLGALTTLSVLDLSSNYIKTFPPIPCKTLRLTTLDLSNNNMSGLPGEMGLVTTLRRLSLEGNPMRTIRRELIIGPVSKLLESLRKKLPVEDEGQELGAFGGRVMITGDPLTQIKNQCRSYVLNNSPGDLDLSDMGLKNLMEEVWESIDYISVLKLNNNPLTEFDGRRLDKAQQLRNLSMQSSQLQTWPLPSVQDCLPVLTILDLSRNRNLQIPKEPFISCMQSLQELNLNGVVDVGKMEPGTFGCLKSLRVVSLSMTNCQTFPNEFVSMTTLQSIDLSQNAIQDLPETITNLTKLEFLDVSNNSITHLPSGIGFMHPVLKTLKVEGNILKTLRRSILTKGTGPLLEYLRERAPMN